MDVKEKTVFVLDHTPYFGIQSKQISLNLLQSHQVTFNKSLWTNTLESTIEYCRIVWDIFSGEKLVRFIISDNAAQIVNTWSPHTQNLDHITNALAIVGAPPAQFSPDYTVIHGLRAAIEALAEMTDKQKEFAQKSSKKVSNKGRIIVCTSARDNASIDILEQFFHQVLVHQNSSVSDQMLKIDFCHLVIVNIYPGTETFVTNRCYCNLSPIFGAEVFSCHSSKLQMLFTNLVQRHYDLASTTIVNIPMKEELNVSQSANYDVEIFHEKSVHSAFTGIELPRSLKSDSCYETVTLKWNPPAVDKTEMQHCVAQSRISPVDARLRATACLITFLLDERSVMLEIQQKTKAMSHVLCAHNGEIYIHALNISRCVFEEAPSISEGVGGKVADYRLQDFVKFAQKLTLRPMVNVRYPDENLKQARIAIARMTKYWPITMSSTIVYSVKQKLEPILAVILKSGDLTEEEVNLGLESVARLSILEKAHVAMIGGQKMKKANKIDEQYRLMWAELEVIVGASGQSAGHKAILQCIRANHKVQAADEAAETKIEVNAASSSMLTRSSSAKSLKRSKFTDRKGESFYDIILAQEVEKATHRMDFSGRLATPAGEIAKLYPLLNFKEKTTRKDYKPHDEEKKMKK